MVGLAVQLRALGAEVPVCAPPDLAELLARIGVPLVPVGQPVCPPVAGATSPSAADLPPDGGRVGRRAVRQVAAAAKGCDALVATGVMPAGVWR
jgi:vancomycin aglycone glucosyltransferase